MTVVFNYLKIVGNAEISTVIEWAGRMHGVSEDDVRAEIDELVSKKKAIIEDRSVPDYEKTIPPTDEELEMIRSGHRPSERQMPTKIIPFIRLVA